MTYPLHASHKDYSVLEVYNMLVEMGCVPRRRFRVEDLPHVIDEAACNGENIIGVVYRVFLRSYHDIAYEFLRAWFENEFLNVSPK